MSLSPASSSPEAHADGGESTDSDGGRCLLPAWPREPCEQVLFERAQDASAAADKGERIEACGVGDGRPLPAGGAGPGTGQRDPPAQARQEEAVVDSDGDDRPLFVRRAPEEYARLDIAESRLTALLRRQASRDDGQYWSCGGLPNMAGAPFQGAHSKSLKVRVHLPPYDNKDSVVSMAVPMGMRVMEFRDEVIRQHASRAGLKPFSTYELRLYDEDEQEPDYDCPPFDKSLQVGCLNVSDVALCPAASASGTPPSPRSPAESSLGEEAAATSGAATPEALDGVPADKVPSLCVSFEDEDGEAGQLRRVGRVEKPLRKGSDSEVCRWLGGHAVSHRRTRSMPHFVGEAKRQDAADSAGAGAAEGRGAAGTRQLRLLVADGAAQAVVAGNVAAAAAAAEPTGPQAGGPDAEACGGSVGESVVLSVRDEATLLEVLEQLSRQRGRTYDPVNFVVERLDDGIRQRLDLNMQVKHLQQRSSVLMLTRKDAPVALSLDEPFPLTWRSEGMGSAPSRREHDVLRRPPATVFFFNEHTASIATEYLVTVAARGSRSRPVECALVVDRERLHHQVPRAWPHDKAEGKKGSFMPPLLKKLGRHLQLSESFRADSGIFVERRVRDVRAVFCGTAHQVFSVVYGGGGSGTPLETSSVELVYQAQTPTECAEIVARLNFLLALVAK